MSNMAYCRFQNAADALRDCHEHMDDPDVVDSGATEEGEARKHLIRTCVEIASDYGAEVER